MNCAIGLSFKAAHRYSDIANAFRRVSETMTQVND
jgi:hypothetical protein